MCTEGDLNGITKIERGREVECRAVWEELVLWISTNTLNMDASQATPSGHAGSGGAGGRYSGMVSFVVGKSSDSYGTLKPAKKYKPEF